MPRKNLMLISMLFILSGVTSLVYETLWIRVLSLGVGSTSASISMVLSIFFLGLAIGSFLTGKVADKIKNPVKFYGLLEGFIGLYSIGLIYFLLNFHHVLAYLPLKGTFSWWGIFAKFAIVFIALLPPTICMGASLPLLVKLFVRKNENMGRYVSLLYALNTLGAVFGAFSASFFFIPNLGVLAANHTAAAINFLILGAALYIGRQNFSQSTQTEEQALPKLKYSASEWSILACCGVMGFSSIAAEVTWNKFLGIFFGTNIYGLGLVLAIFLFGIALGSLAISFVIDKVKNKSLLFINLFFLSAMSIFLTSKLLNFAPLFSSVLSYYLGSAINLLTIKSVVSTAVLLPSTLIFGALFPLAINILTKDSKRASQVVGGAYAVNTIGSILGSYLAGIVLIPFFSSAVSIKVSVVAIILTGALAVMYNIRGFRLKTTYSFIAAALLVSGLSLGNIDFKNILKSAYYQASTDHKPFSEIIKYYQSDYEEFKMISEGESGIISLSHDRQDGPNYQDFYRLKTNGLNESIYTRKNLKLLPKYEGLLGLLPYAISRNPESAFVVGYGGGFTVDFLSQLDLKKVDVAELEKGILKAADYVYNGDNPILKRENLNVRIEDARYVMATKISGPYDIIVSQPSHSWLSGVANLFTQEFFEIVKGNLTERGVFSQWLNLYNMDEAVLKSIMRTFYSVFPHGVVFTDRNDQEMIMIGSMSPVRFHWQKLEAMTQNPTLQANLSQLPFDDAFSFLSVYTASRQTVMEETKGAKLNTDINAFAEASQSSLFYSAKDLHGVPQSFLSSLFKARYSDFVTGINTKDPTFLYNQAMKLLSLNKIDKFLTVVDEFERISSTDQNQHERIGYLMLMVQRYASADHYLRSAVKSNANTQATGYLASSLIQQNKFSEAISLLATHNGKNQSLDCLKADALHKTGVKLSQNKALKSILKEKSAYRESCGIYFDKLLGQHFFRIGQYSEALPYLESYYQSYPTDETNIQQLVTAYLQTGDQKNWQAFSSYYQTVSEQNKLRKKGLSEYFKLNGYNEDIKALKNLPVL